MSTNSAHFTLTNEFYDKEEVYAAGGLMVVG
jgi:hypothetical protein